MNGIALLTANPTDRIALRGVRVIAHIAGMSQKTTLEQTFVNLENEAIEAVYTFPLPEDAAVCAFEVITGDHVLTGTIDEREKAIEKYDDAINEGHGAMLMEQDRPDVFNVRVGNLKPRQAATIRITYVQELELFDRALRLSIPTTVAPRYVTTTASDPEEMMIDAHAINPPHVLSVPYGLTLEINIDLGRALKSIASPSHPLQTEFLGDNRYRVHAAGKKLPMDRDVIVNMELAKDMKPTVQIGDGIDGGKYLAVSFVPDFPESHQAHDSSDVTFVIDCSGSMEGESISQATTALELCLRSMNIGDRFNICRFGSTFELMSREPWVYSNETLKKALAYVQRIDANLGGTELHQPLAACLSIPTKSMRQIILLTDGEVSNEAAIIALAKAHRASNRIFSFGIGASPSAHLVKGLARATGGASEFISANENIADKVLRTFGRMHSPALQDVTLDVDGAEIQLATQSIPPIFDGDKLTLFGRLMGTAPKRITLRGKIVSGETSWSVDVPTFVADSGMLGTMWAKRWIQNLEEQRAAASDESEINEQLVKLSKTFNLLCSLTSFIAIEHRSIEDRTEDRPALRRVPVMLAHGWGGFVLRGPAGGKVACAMAPAQFTMDRTIDRLRDSISRPAKRRSLMSRFFGGKQDSSFAEFDDQPLGSLRDSLMEAAPAPKPARQSPLQKLLSCQSAEGFFELDSATIKSLSKLIDLKMLQKQVATRLSDMGAPSSPETESTLVVLLVLRRHFADQEGVWRAAAAKAMRYVSKITGKSLAEIEASLVAEPTV